MSDSTLSSLEKERHVVGMALRDTDFLEYLHAQMLATDWLNLTHRAIVESAHAAYTLVGRLPEPADTIIAGERIGHLGIVHSRHRSSRWPHLLHHLRALT